MDHIKFMNKALRKAEIGIKNGQTPFGACIVIDGRVIACEHNQVWNNTDITAHAEIQAIRKACKKINTIDLRDAIIYSTCEPCPMCFSAIHWAKIRTIVYAASIADAKRFGFNELAISNLEMKKNGKLKTKIVAFFEREEALKLFVDWKKKHPESAY